MRIEIDKRLVILGKTGKGKTYALKKMVRNVAKDVLVIVYDIKHNMYGMQTLPDLNRLNFDIGKGLVRYKSKNTAEDFEKFNKWIWDNVATNKNRKILVVYDEIQRFVGTNQISKYPEFSQLVFMGRSYGIGLWFATQRPAKIDTSILSQSNYFITFNLTNPNDLTALEGYFTKETVKSLPKYHFLLYDDELEEVKQFAPL